MKKSLFFVAAAVLALASCNNDVVLEENTAPTGQQQEITLSPLAQKVHRAPSRTPVATTTFPTDYHFYIAAYAVDAASDYFDKAEYANVTSTATWSGITGNKQYWPLSKETLNFLAVTKAGSSTTTFGTGTPTKSNFASQVVVELADNKTTQHDLMYSFARAAVTKDGNILSFNNGDNVSMTFNHALAWVYFRVKAGNEASQVISIKDIKLKGANYAGIFQAAVDNYDSSATALAWNTSNTKWTAASTSSDNYSPNFSSAYDTDADGDETNDSKALTSSFVGVGDGLLVVPTSEISPATNSISSFDIEYYLNGNLYTYNYVPAVLTYEKGKKYIYDITMTLHEIIVEPSVVAWTDGGTEIVTIPATSFAYVASTGETGTFTLPSATAGTYSCAITGLPADTYTVEEGTSGTDFITSLSPSETTISAGDALNISFTVTASSGNSRTIVIKNDESTPETLFTLTVTQP